MIGGIMIEYRATGTALVQILDAVKEAGFALRGIRVIPTFGSQQAMLSLELGNCTEPEELADIERRIMTTGVALNVIHPGRAGATS